MADVKECSRPLKKAIFCGRGLTPPLRSHGFVVGAGVTPSRIPLVARLALGLFE
jgi:hypothetical protein